MKHIALLGCALFALISPAKAQENAGLPAPATVLPDTSFGHVMYDLALLTPDGSETRFEAFRDKVLFVNFWATWCVPCVREIPGILELKESLGDAPVEFLLISVDDRPLDVNKFLRTRYMSVPVYLRGWKLGESNFKGIAIPTTYLVSREGEIVYRHTGAADWSGEPVKQLLMSLLDAN